MTETAGTIEQFNLGKVVVDAFDAIEHRVWLFLGLALLLLATPLFAINLWHASAITTMTSIRETTIFVLLPALAARFVVGGLVQAVLINLVLREASGVRIGFSASLSAMLRLGPPALAIFIIISIASGLVSLVSGAVFGFFVRPTFGMLMSFVMIIPAIPGIWMWAVLSVAIPAYIEEPIGPLASLGRSARLTIGSRARIFAVGLALLVAQTVLTYFLQHMLRTPLLWALTATVGSTLLATLSAALTASIYLELRRIKDGGAPGELARVFA